MSGEINRRLNKILAAVDEKELTKVAIDTFKENTPVASGNAKKRTRAVNNEIRAEYAYATRLDQGWSKKKPDGMSKPTIEAIQEYVRNGLKK